VPLTPGPTRRSGIAIQDRRRGTKRCHRLQAAVTARSRSNPHRGGHQSRGRRPPWPRGTSPSSSSLSVKPGNSAAERARNRNRHHPDRLLMRQGHGDDLYERWSDTKMASLTPRHGERKVRGRRTQRPAANTVLTTAVETWGRSWTPRCPEQAIWPDQADCRGLAWTRTFS
jgi:hypothetical protein